MKIPVRTSFCGWLVLRRQRIGIGCKGCLAISLLRVGIEFVAFFTHQSQKCKVRSGVDSPRYEKIQYHVDTPATPFRREFPGQRVPEIVNGYALED